MEETEKAREQAEKARDQAEQEGYDVGVAETEEALKAEVSGVCRNYCLQVWNEALNQVWNEAFNQARVKTSSILRKAKNVYYPLVIWASDPVSSNTYASLEVAEVDKASPAKALVFSDNPSEVAQ